jgi:hypothetical protein
MCRGGNTRHHHGPWGSGGHPGLRRAARLGLLDVRQELGAFVRQLRAAPKQVAGRMHVSWIDIGLRKHAAA